MFPVFTNSLLDVLDDGCCTGLLDCVDSQAVK